MRGTCVSESEGDSGKTLRRVEKNVGAKADPTREFCILIDIDALCKEIEKVTIKHFHTKRDANKLIQFSHLFGESGTTISCGGSVERKRLFSTGSTVRLDFFLS